MKTSGFYNRKTHKMATIICIFMVYRQEVFESTGGRSKVNIEVSFANYHDPRALRTLALKPHPHLPRVSAQPLGPESGGRYCNATVRLGSKRTAHLGDQTWFPTESWHEAIETSNCHEQGLGQQREGEGGEKQDQRISRP